MAISTLAYKLVMDHKEFTEGAVASRKELNLAKRLMAESKTDAEQLEDAIGSLGALMKKGAIDTKTYERQVERLRKEFEKTEDSSEDLGGKFVRMQTAATAAGNILATGFSKGVDLATDAVRGLVNAVGDQFDAIDKLAKTARRLDLSTTDLATFELLGSRGGVERASFAKSFEDFEKNLGAAARGAGRARPVLARLGLSIEDLINLDPATAFVSVAEAIGKLESSAVQIDAARALFGESGADIVKNIDLTAEAFASAQKDVKAFGLAIEGDGAAKVEAMNDQLADLELIVKGTARTIAEELADPIKNAADEIEEFVKTEGGVRKLVKGFGDLADAANKVWGVMKELGKTYQDFGQIVDALDLDPLVSLGLRQQADIFKAGPNVLDSRLETSADVRKRFAELGIGDVNLFPGGSVGNGRRPVNTAVGPQFGVSNIGGKILADRARDSLIRAMGIDFARLGLGVGPVIPDVRSTAIGAGAGAGGLGVLSGLGLGVGGDAAIKAFESASKKADELKKRLRTPIEKFQDRMKELEALLGGDDELLRRGREAATLDLAKALGFREERQEQARFAGAALAGSQADIAIRAAARQGGAETKTESRLAEAVKFLRMIAEREEIELTEVESV